MLDFEKTVQMSDNDVEEANLTLSLFFNESLPTSKELLVEGFEKRDILALRAACHRLAGALLYLALPRLDAALRQLHSDLKDRAEIDSATEALYQSLLKEMEVSDRYYRSLQTSR